MAKKKEPIETGETRMELILRGLQESEIPNIDPYAAGIDGNGGGAEDGTVTEPEDGGGRAAEEVPEKGAVKAETAGRRRGRKPKADGTAAKMSEGRLIRFTLKEHRWLRVAYDGYCLETGYKGAFREFILEMFNRGFETAAPKTWKYMSRFMEP